MGVDIDPRFHTDLQVGTLLRSRSDGTIVIRVNSIDSERQVYGVHHVRNDGERDRRHGAWSGCLDRRRWSITNTPRKERRV